MPIKRLDTRMLEGEQLPSYRTYHFYRCGMIFLLRKSHFLAATTKPSLKSSNDSIARLTFIERLHRQCHSVMRYICTNSTIIPSGPRTNAK